LTNASQKIQIDRYSLISEKNASIALLDSINTFNGWKIILDKQNAWISYNAVDFGSTKLKSVQVKASSQMGSTLEIRLDKANGTLLAEVNIPKGTVWKAIDASILKYQKGIHNLIAVLKDNNPAEVDWIRFTN
jgi:hypothetical protein